jgi:uncharacterized protein
MTRSEILEILKQYKKENSEKYGINNLGIFGSYSRDLATDDSDIDIVIETQEPDLYRLVHIKEDLEKLFNKSVDIVRNREKMNPYLKKRIEKDAQYV